MLLHFHVKMYSILDTKSKARSVEKAQSLTLQQKNSILTNNQA